MAFPFTDDDSQDDFGSSPAFGYDGEEESSSAPEGESNNRTFLIASAVLGGILLLSLICMAGYALFFWPQQQATRATQQAQIDFNNTQVAGAFTATAQVLLYTPTVLPTETPVPSVTPVLALATATLQVSTPEPITATVAAAYTQAALAQLTIVPTSLALGTALAVPSALPDTGFIDEVGLPGLLIVTTILFAVILLARKLRSASST